MNSTPLELWIARPAAFEESRSECAALLAPEETARWQTFRFDRDRQQFLATRVLVRRALTHSRPTAPQDWRFTANRYGKPDTTPPCGLEFNLSNAPQLVACLVSAGGAVGLDLEPLTRAQATLDVARRVFSPVELEQIHRLPDAEQPSRSLTLWTLKEAYTKARGMGMSLPLQQITFQMDGEQGLTLEVPEALDSQPERWRFALFDHSEHRFALCVEANEDPALRLLELSSPHTPPRFLPPPDFQWFSQQTLSG